MDMKALVKQLTVKVATTFGLAAVDQAARIYMDKKLGKSEKSSKSED